MPEHIIRGSKYIIVYFIVIQLLGNIRIVTTSLRIGKMHCYQDILINLSDSLTACIE